MNNKSRKNWIEQLIHSTMRAVGIEIERKQNPTGVNMSYNFILNYIGYDVKRIEEAIKEMQAQVSLECYIKAFTLHELGHALDRKALLDSLTKTLAFYEMKKNHTIYEQYSEYNLLSMLIEEHEMNIAFEETAWANAEKLNMEYGIVDWDSFEKAKNHGMATYLKLYEKDLEVYNKLVSEQNDVGRPFLFA
ncbi:integrase [Neobacillus sp. 179-C4.2 HS]|uniref:Integrase n=1 Tax=Neobacillus driksii TaxID=3035913 RepID=A0ABV4Z3Y6_9BACI|nr:integrase [Neobacillus sp. 179.-C4.2 HS]MDP5197723.1 integrase [Neobacillus sp. 179.-C4.2 HS]